MLIVKINNQQVDNAQAAQDSLAKGSLDTGILLQVRSPQGGVNYILLQNKSE